MKRTLPVAVVCLKYLFVSQTDAAKWSTDRPTKKIVYKTIGDVELSLHVFEPEGHKATDKRPAIVFFFGGGWTGGSPGQFYPHCKYLASRGMVACSAEYRVKSRNGTTPFECVKDGKSAVRYLRANAASLGLDPEKIAAGGGSAGGHVGACTGTIDGQEEEGEDASVSSKPDAMALFNPVIDTSDKGYGYSRLKEKFELISPVHNVKKGVPPTIFFHGTKDTCVPFANAKDFDERMEKAGNRCELVEFEGRGHGFFNAGRGGGGDYWEITRKMDEFLASLGYLEGKPVIPEKK
jgi:acetyl esterase